MRNIKLTIEYDGTLYSGWQKQNNAKTIQETIEKALSKILKAEVSITGSSRTDSGVHAKGMVANFFTDSRIPAEKFREAINTKLPDDIAIIKSEEVDLEFHARYLSKGKTYCYTIINRYEKVALYKNYSHHVREKLDLELMNKCCKMFIGKHDFSAFKTVGSSVKTSVRTISDLHIEKEDDFIKIYVTADGFLYNMVRIIVGTLIEVGQNKRSIETVKKAINSCNREDAGYCVPPNGLILEKVYY
ncbi:tRNA pseudouridine(38-40) synthase TruA [Clostridium thermobutyricum]|uniref:tRNA pseudouridine synthase A n=1 Tax=Clostridium thermobutyricum DSM 4928 TaxID=1121339 RepID=A0A1V4STJ9_9CLOT|nr:tRNA pseudouridine(38-40) synthase TruA [Clostridium thermobutyricum]OPX46765.1 tRNA pseudouridine synthase A [Clostridium thermobutyricum DSM 4928]